VRLRQPLEDDIPAITSGASEPSVALYTTVPSPYQESDARWFVDEVRTTWQAGTAATFAVCDAAEPAVLLGMVGLHNIEQEGNPGGRAEIGYWLASPARGRGLMSRAVRVISAWGVDELGLARIDWVAAVGNTPSRNVVDHCGYRFEGTCRLGMKQRGQRIDAWVGGLIATELIR
jgi:RimJ/RimL family protein N-acetyltransferase